LFGYGSVAIFVKQLKSLLDIIKGLESLAYLKSNINCRWEHNTDKFSHINFTIAIYISKSKDSINFFGVIFVSRRSHYLLLTEQTIIIGVNFLKSCLHIIKILKAFAYSFDHTRSRWAHESNKLFKGDFTIPINVSKAENCINLNIRIRFTRTLQSSCKLLFFKCAISIPIKSLKGRFYVIYIFVLCSKLFYNIRSRWAHECYEFFIVNLTISIHITSHENSVNFLFCKVSSSRRKSTGELCFVNSSISIFIKLLKCILNILYSFAD